jgi:hypothetical protein
VLSRKKVLPLSYVKRSANSFDVLHQLAVATHPDCLGGRISCHIEWMPDREIWELHCGRCGESVRIRISRPAEVKRKIIRAMTSGEKFELEDMWVRIVLAERGESRDGQVP